MKSSSSRSTAFSGLGSLFSLLLFLVFVLCALFTIMTGSRVYANIQDKDNAIFTRDTSVSYIKNKVRQADRAGQISVRDMEGVSVLCIADGELSTADTVYETYIYARDGWLMELFTSRDSGLTLADGIPVMECGDAAFQILTEDGTGERGREVRLLSLRLDSREPSYIRLMCGEAAAETGSLSPADRETAGTCLETALPENAAGTGWEMAPSPETVTILEEGGIL